MSRRSILFLMLVIFQIFSQMSLKPILVSTSDPLVRGESVVPEVPGRVLAIMPNTYVDSSNLRPEPLNS